MRVIFSIIFFVFSTSSGVAQQQLPVLAVSPVDALTAAFVAKNQGDWDGALALAQPAGFVGIDLIEWHRLRASQGNFQDTLNFLRRRPDWPGLPLLRKRSEISIEPDAAAADVLSFFAAQAPRTAHGALQLALTYRKIGREAEAQAEAKRGWRSFDANDEVEQAYITNFANALKGEQNARMEMLLWAGEHRSVLRQLPRITPDYVKLAQARLALQTNAGGLDVLLGEVPTGLQSDPGLAFDRFTWLMTQKRRDEAITLLLAQSRNAGALGQPEAWADERHNLSRDLLWNGQVEQAYRVAANHFLQPGQDFAKLEWLAGFLALRKLSRPDLALFHFQRHGLSIKSPISLGRTHYWQGRAYEAAGNAEEAQAAYMRGAQHQTAFYGLLSAEKAGVPLSPTLTGAAKSSGWRQSQFAKSSVFNGGLLLLNAEQPRLGVRFLTHLTESLSPSEMGQIMGMAEEIGLPYLQLMLAKRGVKFGTVLERAYYPLHPLARQTGTVPAELALAIARRESEFFVDAKSGVGALGLMQLMPPTAQEMADKLGVAFSREKLTRDATYNGALGVRYLQELQATFGNSPVQIAAAYNAGPSRPNRWMAKLGDPRRSEVDVIDWIEQIPFDETRNYVMRVTESLPVYRARISGQVGELNFTKELIGEYVVPAPVTPPSAPETSLKPRLRPATLPVFPATE